MQPPSTTLNRDAFGHTFAPRLLDTHLHPRITPAPRACSEVTLGNCLQDTCTAIDRPGGSVSGGHVFAGQDGAHQCGPRGTTG